MCSESWNKPHSIFLKYMHDKIIMIIIIMYCTLERYLLVKWHSSRVTGFDNVRTLHDTVLGAKYHVQWISVFTRNRLRRAISTLLASVGLTHGTRICFTAVLFRKLAVDSSRIHTSVSCSNNVHGWRWQQQQQKQNKTTTTTTTTTMKSKIIY
jgi:hypothetical protein